MITTTTNPSTGGHHLASPRAGGALTAWRSGDFLAVLRTVLKANAAFSLLGGVVAVAAGAVVADLLDVNVWLVRVIGAGLVIFAADVWWVARRPANQITTYARLVSAADASWVVGTVVVIALGLVSTAGAIVLAVVAAAVADFGALQWYASAKADRAALGG